MSLNPIKNGLGSLIHELLIAGSGSTYSCRCKNVKSPRTNPEIRITVTRNVIGSLFLSLDFFYSTFMNEISLNLL